MIKVIYAVSGALSVLAVTFLMIGCIGYSSEGATIQNVPWIKYEDHSDTIWFALRKAYVDVGAFYKDTLAYTDEGCVNSFCDRCNRDGKASFALLVVATVFAAITACISYVIIIATPTFQLRITNIFTAMVAFGFSLIAIGLFMRDCYKKIRSVNIEGSFSWGSGAVLSLIGSIIMFIVLIMQFFVTAANIRGDDVLLPDRSTTANKI